MKKFTVKFKNLNKGKWLIIVLIPLIVALSVTFLIFKEKSSVNYEGAVVSKENTSYGVSLGRRDYASYAEIDKYSDITEKRLEVKDISGNLPKADYYSVKGLDSSYVICRRDHYANLSVYLSLSEIPLYKGSDIYEDIFKMSENTVSYSFIERTGKYDSFDSYEFKEEYNGTVRNFFNYLSESEFFYKSDDPEADALYLEGNEYYIVFNFENGFNYGVRLYDGGFVIPCCAGDICQKIPKDMYQSIMALIEDSSASEYVGNSQEYFNNDLSLEELENNETVAPYIPSYIPERVYNEYAGYVKYNVMIDRNSTYKEDCYDKDTGKITGPGYVRIKYNMGENWYVISIIFSGSEKYDDKAYIGTEAPILCEELTLDFIKENNHNKEEIEFNGEVEHVYNNYDLTVDYGGVLVNIQSSRIEPEDVYRILKSIEP